jgi:uracil-DNA glycosylase
MNLTELNSELISCMRCPRLVEWREQIATEKRRAYRDWDYWGKPVPGFGDKQAQVFVVGLAPGAHGSNRTGRQFTGDASGDFLYPALFRAGFASQPHSISREDGLELINLYTSPVCHCVPPENKPSKRELDNCEPFLIKELEIIKPKVLVALGRVALDRIMNIFFIRKPNIRFAHNLTHNLPGGRWLVSSFHPSRQNTQTGRLTAHMFDEVWETVRVLLKEKME